MGLVSNVKYTIRTFINMPNKGAALKKSISVLREQGVPGLKRAINATGQMQEDKKDLYEKQQSVQKEYKEYAQSVLFIIYSLNGEVDISDTYNQLVAQIKKQDRIVVIKTKDKSDWENRISCETLICEKTNVSECLKELILRSNQDYVYFLKGGNYLAPNMRNEFAKVLFDFNPDVVYSDECVFASDSGRIARYDVRPGFSEYDLYQDNQCCQSVMFEQKLFEKLLKKQMFSSCLENMIMGLMLDAVRETSRIVHFDQVLLFKKDILEERNLPERRLILESHLKELTVPMSVAIVNGRLRLGIYENHLKASIIIIAQHLDQTRKCIEKIVNNTMYVDYELVVVGEFKLLDKLTAQSEVHCMIKGISCDNEDTYTNKCNIAAKEANGEILVFMQEDMRVKNASWLWELLGIFAFSYVGGVSPKIIRRDNTIRYAGMIAGGFGLTPIPFNGEDNQCEMENNKPAFLNHQVSVLSASCMAIRKDAFKAIGCFDSKNFTDKFSNAQLSFALMRVGYACIYCADSVLETDGEDWYDSWYTMEHPTAYLQLLRNYGEELSEDHYFTESMKCLYLRGVPINFRIYQKKNENIENRKRILMISHDSLLGGATIAFQYAARALKRNGYYIVWLVQEEGAMLDELERDGIDYIVDPSFKGSDEWLNYATNFELVMCSTILLGIQVELLKNMGVTVIWWVHEAREYYDSSIISKLTEQNLDKLNVWCGGIYAEKTFREYFAGISTEVMVYGVPDYTSDEDIYNEVIIENPMNKMIFLSIGTIESRKGQDILVEAIRKLDPVVRERCIFAFVGKVIQENIYAKICKVADEYPESVIFMKPVDRKTLMRMYHQSDVVLCTSREDPMPVFMTECMMQSKVAICSENTGTAGVLTDGYDGFIYHNNSADELKKKITYVLNNKNDMQQVGDNARKTYEKIFSMEVFEKKLQNHIKEILGE